MSTKRRKAKNQTRKEKATSRDKSEYKTYEDPDQEHVPDECLFRNGDLIMGEE